MLAPAAARRRPNRNDDEEDSRPSSITILNGAATPTASHREL